MIAPKIIPSLIAAVLCFPPVAAETEFDPAAEFHELATGGKISQLCRERSTLNIPAKTLGGKVWWDTLECGQWKLQFHKISGHWRIIDPENKRRAWGTTLSQLKKFLQNHPTSFSANYFDAGECFYRYPGKSKKTVILIHGWAVRAVSLAPFAEMLQREGFNVLNYDYPSSAKISTVMRKHFCVNSERRKFPEKYIFSPTAWAAFSCATPSPK